MLRKSSLRKVHFEKFTSKRSLRLIRGSSYTQVGEKPKYFLSHNETDKKMHCNSFEMFAVHFMHLRKFNQESNIDRHFGVKL